MPLHTGLFVESNPIPAKWVLAEMGRIGSWNPAAADGAGREVS